MMEKQVIIATKQTSKARTLPKVASYSIWCPRRLCGVQHGVRLRSVCRTHSTTSDSPLRRESPLSVCGRYNEMRWQMMWYDVIWCEGDDGMGWDGMNRKWTLWKYLLALTMNIEKWKKGIFFLEERCKWKRKEKKEKEGNDENEWINDTFEKLKALNFSLLHDFQTAKLFWNYLQLWGTSWAWDKLFRVGDMPVNEQTENVIK